MCRPGTHQAGSRVPNSAYLAGRYYNSSHRGPQKAGVPSCILTDVYLPLRHYSRLAVLPVTRYIHSQLNSVMPSQENICLYWTFFLA